MFPLSLEVSQGLSDEHNHYWGTRQQMMCGKVIADWLEKREKKVKNSTYDAESFDPIFGVLLNPTGGKIWINVVGSNNLYKKPILKDKNYMPNIFYGEKVRSNKVGWNFSLSELAR